MIVLGEHSSTRMETNQTWFTWITWVGLRSQHTVDPFPALFPYESLVLLWNWRKQQIELAWSGVFTVPKAESNMLASSPFDIFPVCKCSIDHFFHLFSSVLMTDGSHFKTILADSRKKGNWILIIDFSEYPLSLLLHRQEKVDMSINFKATVVDQRPLWLNGPV